MVLRTTEAASLVAVSEFMNAGQEQQKTLPRDALADVCYQKCYALLAYIRSQEGASLASDVLADTSTEMEKPEVIRIRSYVAQVIWETLGDAVITESSALMLVSGGAANGARWDELCPPGTDIVEHYKFSLDEVAKMSPNPIIAAVGATQKAFVLPILISVCPNIPRKVLIRARVFVVPLEDLVSMVDCIVGQRPRLPHRAAHVRPRTALYASIRLCNVSCRQRSIVCQSKRKKVTELTARTPWHLRQLNCPFVVHRQAVAEYMDVNARLRVMVPNDAVPSQYSKAVDDATLHLLRVLASVVRPER